MQPHGPYFGEKAKTLREKLVAEHNIQFTRLSDTANSSGKKYADLMYAAKDGYLSSEQVREIYIENLEIVLEYARTLADNLEGKTVISADHGENLGNPGGLFAPKYGHNGFSPEVRFVPWMVLDYDNRKNVTREPPIESEGVDEETVAEQLKHLGYL